MSFRHHITRPVRFSRTCCIDCKKGLKETEGSWQSRIARVLFAYRITPLSTTGVSPSELLLGRQLRSRLDLIRPNTTARVEFKQQMKESHDDVHSRKRKIEVGNQMYMQNFSSGPRWLPGEVAKATGPVSFLVQLTDGRMIRRHQDQMRVRKAEPEPSNVPHHASMELAPTILEGPAVEDVTLELPQSITEMESTREAPEVRKKLKLHWASRQKTTKLWSNLHRDLHNHGGRIHRETGRNQIGLMGHKTLKNSR